MYENNLLLYPEGRAVPWLPVHQVFPTGMGRVCVECVCMCVECTCVVCVHLYMCGVCMCVVCVHVCGVCTCVVCVRLYMCGVCAFVHVWCVCICTCVVCVHLYMCGVCICASVISSFNV